MFNLNGLAHDNFYVTLFALLVNTAICIGIFFAFRAWGVFKNPELIELIREVKKTNKLLEEIRDNDKNQK